MPHFRPFEQAKNKVPSSSKQDFQKISQLFDRLDEEIEGALSDLFTTK